MEAAGGKIKVEKHGVYSFYSKVKQPEHIQRAGVPNDSPLVAVEGLKKKSDRGSEVLHQC